MDLSLIIPAYNEEESIPELVAWIKRVMANNNLQYDIWFVDDGSTDKTWKVLDQLHSEDPIHVKAIKFRRNYGKSAALNTAFHSCQGSVVITMDADLQDSPEEIPELYRMIVEDDFDIVSGWKKIRHDNAITKNLPSKLYNSVTGWMSGVKLHDMNCGLKAYKKDVVKSIEVFGEMHRYIPVIAKWAGFRKITEKIVQHYPRKYGYSKFGISRFINGFLDLATILFIGKFGKRPMHFFGSLGISFFFVGFCFVIYLGFTKYVYQVYGMTERPAFFIALVAMIIGSQLFLTGFIAELISRNASERNHYLVDKTLS
ncbi:MAG: glycosyltransferase family 2 protein [Saprospiraceae bacterium]|jgi:glycosyltransferase involved in cell wall biosynthesis|uniref:Glycosyltransferase family 2 protein n=1 Tax=Candidatus Defluviibacterium haderslevense TaxID=2981993 RepID=A0A9D7S5E4_9BACT|nr:glycosyltransferase family 2 protein [Candidatus Defluviibacterium haderslevense]MBK7243194.1 glycosyltransferase family 2 protein [Candidatus Defluviibacterium haderslevense]MBK9716175.1 glycosyltransferase family 2 protein [Candidatus Defluviibacterium haderslevense]MBL0238498.1 glycosyltransferase family 2 protein [Candidatus Defluviibacterium haderslevense]MCI1266769.1 glycosyltransferase [Saprospiraceae bacterium]